MTSTEAKLEKYTLAVQAAENYRKEHSAIFSRHASLVDAIIDAENELRDEIEVTKQAPKNKYFEVKITPQSMTFADIEEIDKVIRDGVLPPSYRDKIVKTQPRPDYVGIRPIPQD